MTKKAISTQNLVNAFPSWSNIRQDEQSLGFQFLNTVGIQMDDMRQQLEILSDNFFLSTARVSDIDLYYYFKLPGNFEFSKEDSDTSALIYTPPTVSGLDANGSFYEVSIAEDNDVESFWYKTSPSRISLGEVVSGAHLLASGYVSESPFEILTPSGLLHIDNKITVKVSGGTTFIQSLENGTASVGIVQLQGQTRLGQDITEEITFLQDGTKQSQHDFDSLEAVRAYNISSPESSFVTVTSAMFNQDDYSVAFPDLARNQNRNQEPLFWSLSSGNTSGQYVLNLLHYDIDDQLIRIAGFSDKSSVLQTELLNSNLDNIHPLDLAVEPHSNNLWIITSSGLYLYDDSLPYPETTQLDQKDYNSPSVIEPSSLYVIKGETIQLDYVWRRPVETFVKHRAWVQKPDGTQYSLEDGVEVAYHTGDSSWIFGEPRKREIRASELYTLDQRGDYLYTLEVLYGNGTTSIDQRIVSVVYKTPKAEYDLSSLEIDNNITGIDIDSEYKIWISNDLDGKFEIKRHYDTMIIDFRKKIIYFVEPFEQIRIY